VNKLTHPNRFAFVALAAVAILLAVSTPSQVLAAAGHGGHRDFGRHHDFDRGHSRFLFGFGPVYPYNGYHPPDYGYEAPTYWYYCASYGAYYPNVASCPEAWVPVPAS